VAPLFPINVSSILGPHSCFIWILLSTNIYSLLENLLTGKVLIERHGHVNYILDVVDIPSSWKHNCEHELGVCGCPSMAISDGDKSEESIKSQGCIYLDGIWTTPKRRCQKTQRDPVA
jgi:hypothetical protein